ncbi:MAG: DUF3662 and FHA domain-containing protein [Actinobacteria bacterium]|jgi:hypothetical protein|nr:DUF3662 and FHA domain-containing protein [Actinomycetota bacterium]MCL6095691.1 DUF3662 and FHA domain-containing protein [Actinomycetota bacterium]
MGLTRFERRLERLVEGVFAKTFPGTLQPVEIGQRIAREMDLQRTIGVRGTIIMPNIFKISLATEDLERFSSFGSTLAKELAEAAYEHAQEERAHLLGAVEVLLLENSDLTPGVFEILCEFRPSEVTEQNEDGAFKYPYAWLVLPDGSRVEIGDQPLLIGRLPICSVLLDDPNVSRQHAEIRYEDDHLLVVDLGSTNGTWVNGSKVTYTELQDEDEIRVGTTTLRVEFA